MVSTPGPRSAVGALVAKLARTDAAVVRLAKQDVSGYLALRPTAEGKKKLTIVDDYTRSVFDGIIRALARRYRERAEERDPSYTPLMKTLAVGHGGELVGAEFRVKGERRMAEKLEEAIFEGKSGPDVKVSDPLRYTMRFDDDTYAASSLSVLDSLERQGFEVRSKNYWRSGDVYDGVNVALTDPSGFPVEVQFHTPDSFRVKEENHPDYEEFREIPGALKGQFKSPEDRARAFELWKRMAERAATIPRPPGVEQIPGERFEPFPGELPSLSGSLGGSLKTRVRRAQR